MSMRLSISCIGLHFSRKPTFNVTNLLHSVGMSNRNHNGTSCTKRYPYFFQGYSLKPHYNDRSSQHAIKHIKWIFIHREDTRKDDQTHDHAHPIPSHTCCARTGSTMCNPIRDRRRQGADQQRRRSTAQPVSHLRKGPKTAGVD